MIQQSEVDSNHEPTKGAGFRFGSFFLDATTGELRDGNEPVKIRHQTFKVLAMLVSRAGELVSRDELQRSLWRQDNIIDFDQGLNHCIKEIRVVLKDSADSPRFVQTLPKRGYRFMMPASAARPERPVVAPPAPELAAASPQAGLEESSPTHGAQTPSPLARASSEAAPRIQAVTQGGIEDGNLGIGRLLSIGVIVATIAVGIGRLSATGIVESKPKSDSGPASTDQGARLVVLPFEDRSTGRSNEFLAEGLTDELITQVGRVNPTHLVVLAHGASGPTTGDPRSLRSLAHDLGVDWVVEGAVERLDDRIRISARLTRATDLVRVWSAVEEEPADRLLAMQHRIAQQIARAAGVSQEIARPMIARLHAEAYVEYLRGLSLWNKRDRASLDAAVLAFRKSINLQDDFASAWVGLANTYSVQIDHGYADTRENWLRAKAAADRALALDGESAEAWTAVAMIRALYEWNWEGAREAFDRAHSLNPNYATAHQWFALLLLARGENEEALVAIDRAALLDPLSPVIRGNRGRILSELGRHQEAIAELRGVVDIRHDWALGHLWLGRALGRSGQISEMVREIEKSASGIDPSPHTLAHLAQAYSRAGRINDARRVADRLGSVRDRIVSPYHLAMAALATGEVDASFAQLERAFDERSPLLRYLARGPEWDDLRADARFQRMARLVSPEESFGTSSAPRRNDAAYNKGATPLP